MDEKTGVISGVPTEPSEDVTPCTVFASNPKRKGSVMINIFVKKSKQMNESRSAGKLSSSLNLFSDDAESISSPTSPISLVQSALRSSKRSPINKILQGPNFTPQEKEDAEIDAPKCIRVNGSVAISKKLVGDYMLMDTLWNGRPAYQRNDVRKGERGPSIFFYNDGANENWFLSADNPRNEYSCAAYCKENVFQPDLIKYGWVTKTGTKPKEWIIDLGLIIEAVESKKE